MKRKVFLISPLACASALALAQTLPAGGKISHGSGSIGVSGSSMLVRQDSARMVADWQSFSIGSDASVRFVQPSTSAVALNRVLGSDPSIILGRLSANGHVYLQNAAGVLFAPSAQVDVGALVATSLNADVGQFAAGHLRLAGSGSGAVRNEGRITAAPGGHVVLAAPQVSNSGSIAAPFGTAALAAGSAVEVDPTGSGLLSIRVPVAAVGARLQQSGRIDADGGSVSLQAVVADAALASVMQVGGVVRARSIAQRDGRIVLSATGPGIVRVDGTLDASGGAGERGGAIAVLGERIGLFDAAHLDASGGGGGGSVLVGGNYQGSGPQPNAQLTYVAPHASIDASARDTGDGGRIVVWSDRLTSFHGAIAARGGSAGGNGGFVEVSGKERLDFAGTVDLSAGNGSRGLLLLDPGDIVIGTFADINGDTIEGDDLVASPLLGTDFPLASASLITAGQVATLLATGDVQLQATNSISVTAPVNVAAGGAASTLFLEAPSITIDSAMSLQNSALVVDTNLDFSDSITVQAPIQSLSSISLASTDTFISDTLTAPNVTLTARANSLSTLSFIGESNVGRIVADTLTVSRNPGAQSSVGLNGPNEISVLRIDANSASVRNIAATPAPIQVSGTVGPGPALGADFVLNTNTGVVQDIASPTGALVVSGGFLLITTDPDPVTGAVRLLHPGNSFAPGPITPALGFDVASSLELSAAGDLDANGIVGSFALLEAVGGRFLLSGNIESLGTSPGPVQVDVRGVGVDMGEGLLLVPAGGRFFIRSSDHTQDVLNSSVGSGPADINHVLLGGWTGAVPGSGNVYVTNALGTIATPAGDVAAVSKVYDGSTAFGYAQSGAAASGTIAFSNPLSLSLGEYTVNGSGNFADKNAGVDKAYTVAPTTDVTATSLSGETYYGLGFAGFTRPAGPGIALSQITPRPLTSTGVAAIDRVYDATSTVGLDVGGAALGNVVAGDVVALAAASALGSTSDKNVGVDKPVVVSGLALTGADAGNYTVSDASSATVTISPLAIGSTGLTGVNRNYNGSTSVAIDTSSGQLGGVLPGDSVTIATAIGTIADKNVGTAKPVTIGSVSLAGPDAVNYSATDSSNATVTIAPAPIFAAGVSGVNRPYDGTTTVALDTGAATLSGAIAGDDVSLVATGATGTMSDKNVGIDKPVVSASGFAITGADAPNYSLIVGSFPITVDITPRELAVAGITAQNRVVDGTTSITLDIAGATLPGVIPGDVVGLDASGASGSVATPDPGVAKPVFVAGIELTGPDAVNYSLLSTPLGPNNSGLTVRILTLPQQAFEDVRHREYLQAVSDAQEPFRRAMAEALAAGFGKENIRKQLGRGLVFETGLAAPAVDTIDSAARPPACQAGAGLACGR